jgi:phenylpropionate dioxygenase-like ring-hydroxylating dioxygenase large terminal subunit
MSTLSPQDLRVPANCTFAPSDWLVLANYWHPVSLASDLTPAKALPVVLLDEELALYRSGGRVVAARDLCIHRGVPISLGWMEGDEIVCAYHGFRYGADGQCTRVPAQPDLAIPKKLCLKTFLVQERYGVIWVCLSGEPRLPLPDWPELEDTALKQLQLGPDLWQCAAARHTENFTDLAHLSWLHAGTFGNRDKPEVAAYEVETTPAGLHFEADYDRYSIDQRSGAQALEKIHYTYDVSLPFYTRLKIAFPDGQHFILFNMPSPRSARQSNILFRMTRDFDVEGPDDITLDVQRGVLAEDRPIVEAQRPEKLPLDLSEEFHIRSDRLSTYYRRALVQLGLGQQFSA